MNVLYLEQESILARGMFSCKISTRETVSLVFVLYDNDLIVGKIEPLKIEFDDSSDDQF